MIGQSSNLPGHQGNPGHWPFGSYTNIHAKTAANWVEHAQLLWCFSIHSQVRKSTVEPLSTISQDASRCSGLLRASYLEHVVRTELINITFPLIQGSAHTHTDFHCHIVLWNFTRSSPWCCQLYHHWNGGSAYGRDPATNGGQDGPQMWQALFTLALSGSQGVCGLESD